MRCKMHVYEVHIHEMYAYEVHAHEVYAHDGPLFLGKLPFFLLFHFLYFASHSR
jgi:hypothetical protein